MSFLTADSDPGQYGRLQAFVMPQGQTVKGPVQVNNDVLRTQAISTAITLLNQQGSSVIQGSMQLIPVGDTLIYVRPFYTQTRGSGAYPVFQFVVVYQQGKGAYCAPTVADGLRQMLGQTSPVTSCSVAAGTTSGGTGSGSPSTTTTTTPGTATTAPANTTVPGTTSTSAQLIEQAATLYDQAQTALKQVNLAQYQQLIDQMGQLIKQAQAQAAAGK